MILLHVDNTAVVGQIIVPDSRADAFLESNPQFITGPAQRLEEPLPCYEYVSGVVQLRADWEAVKDALEAEAEVPDTSVATVTQASVKYMRQLDTQRDQAFAEGVAYDFGSGPDAIQVREQDRANINGLVLAARNLLAAGDNTTITPFRATSNTVYQMIPDAVIAMGNAAFTGVSQIYTDSWTKKDQIQAIVDGFTEGEDANAAVANMQAVVGN